jgi:hypothetical protein
MWDAGRRKRRHWILQSVRLRRLQGGSGGEPRARIRRRDAGSRQRCRWILQSVNLRRQQGELTGYSFQIRLLSCSALRERHQRSCVFLLRQLNILQCRSDDRVRYRGWSRLRWRLCGDPIEVRQREAAEVRQGEAINFRQGNFRQRELIEIRQGEAAEARQGIGGSGTNDGQGSQRHRYRRRPARSHRLCRLGPFVSLRFLIGCFGHVRSLRLSPGARFFPIAGQQNKKEPPRGGSSNDSRAIAPPELVLNHGLMWLIIG